ARRDLVRLGGVQQVPELRARGVQDVSARPVPLGLRRLPLPGTRAHGRREERRPRVQVLAAARDRRRRRCGREPARAERRRRPDLPDGERDGSGSGLDWPPKSVAAAPAIAVAGLGRDYGRVRAVDAIDLEVQPGEFFGFLGPNGAGKTTIRMLTTLLSPSRGEARVAGSDVVDDALAVRRQIGVVFQETTLDLDLTAAENLRFCTRLYG